MDVGHAVQSTATLGSKDEFDQQPTQKQSKELVEMSMTSLLIKSKQTSANNKVIVQTATKTDGFDMSLEDTPASN